MCSKNIGFLLTVFVTCLVSNAFAASSVRALGQNSAGSNVAVASPLNNASVVSKTRKSSLPLNKNKISTVWGQDSKKASGNSGQASTSANRLSIINKNMQNLQKQLSNSTPAGGSSGSSGAANAAISEIMNRMDMLQEQIYDLRTDIADLSNYYTSGQVDEKLQDIQTQLSEMDIQVQNIGNSTSVQQIQQLTETVAAHTAQLENIQDGITNPTIMFDSETNERKTNVAIVDVFDDNILDQW